MYVLKWSFITLGLFLYLVTNVFFLFEKNSQDCCTRREQYNQSVQVYSTHLNSNGLWLGLWRVWGETTLSGFDQCKFSMSDRLQLATHDGWLMCRKTALPVKLGFYGK